MVQNALRSQGQKLHQLEEVLSTIQLEMRGDLNALIALANKIDKRLFERERERFDSKGSPCARTRFQSRSEGSSGDSVSTLAKRECGTARRHSRWVKKPFTAKTSEHQQQLIRTESNVQI
ncbi:hypothetical protein F2P81_001186 [Scophthalmus maximus]|uniref:Uncharacterized protein n=1 Tax=Scophthalmus maximus TaxID=52904 RepID=A0A6A4TMZ7_SCOMX|nr:hypothetical protein F2P81_001186 [Scophthalmus maximus]